ncbi:amino acid racemase [Actinomycetaceae bacterium L2_0104]
MRKLGMVGGTGPESTISYYRAVIAGVQATEGSHSLPPLVIESLSVFEVLGYCSREDYDGLAGYLLSAIERLATVGAEVVTLTGLTPHIVFDQLSSKSPVPLISAVETTRDAALERGVGRLALLGTEYTMTQDFFARPLRDAGLEVVTPSQTEIAYIQDKIVSELEHGIVTDETHDGFVAIIERLRDEHGCQQVVLGCTELPLLLNDASSPLPCLDTVEIHTRALVAAITE